MKTKLIFLSILLFFAISINAQLEVKNTGYVKVTNAMAIGTEPESNTGLYIKRSGTGNASPFHGLKSQITLNAYIHYPLYGIYGEANALNVTYMQAPQPIIGVYGIAKKNENLITLAAGVAGLTHTKGGVGVFGGIGSLISSLPANAKYAG